MALNGLICTEMPLRNYSRFASLANSLTLTPPAGGRPAMTRFWFWSIDRYFDIGDVRRVDDPSKLCPCAPVVGERQPLMFEHTIADLVQRPPYINASGVLIDGYFQSWKYASEVEYELRQSLRWKPSITSAVSRYSVVGLT